MRILLRNKASRLLLLPSRPAFEEAAASAAAGLAGVSTLGFAFLPPSAMAKVNGRFLGHEGSTDVITFDYRTGRAGLFPGDDSPDAEILVCPHAALDAAGPAGFPREMAVYVAHGILHLAGMEDGSPAGRRAMRHAERRMVAALPHPPESLFALNPAGVPPGASC